MMDTKRQHGNAHVIDITQQHYYGFTRSADTI